MQQREISPAFWVIMGVLLLFLSTLVLLGSLSAIQKWRAGGGSEDALVAAGVLAAGLLLVVAGLTLIRLRSSQRITAILRSPGFWVPGLILCGAGAVAAVLARKWSFLGDIALLVVSVAYMVQASVPASAEPAVKLRAFRKERWWCVLFYLTFGVVAFPWGAENWSWFALLVVVLFCSITFLQLRNIAKRIREAEALPG
jgi:hypothetical protein